MSGIAGIIRFDGAPVEPGLVEKMTATMPYRGPDGIHHRVKGSVALGQCLLRTTPESLEETLPLTNEDESLVLVMDGRVDNWEVLRKELLGRGVILRTRADAELVLRAYEAWGRECLAHIDGDFALVIWDARRREAFCARDRIGNKSFTYHWDGKALTFASELHAITALPGMTVAFNEGVVAEFLGNDWYSRDETFWTGIMRLTGGHRMVVDAGGPRTERYWQPDLWATLPYKKDADYIEHYKALLTDVVRRTSRSHQPLAFEVSGGLDSSALFAMAEHLRRDRQLPAPAMYGYTLDFHDGSPADELAYVRAVAAHLDLPIQEIPPTRMPVSWYRDWAARYREFPSYPNAIMAIGLREQARRDGCRTVITGVGGDEWLGMPWTGAYYTEALFAHQWRNLFLYLGEDARDMGLPRALWLLGRHGLAPLLPEPVKQVLRTLRRVKRRESWLTSAMQALLHDRRRRLAIRLPARLARHGQAVQIRMLEGAYDAISRELEDRLTASLQLDLRRPFFHPAIIQFAFSTPERLRLHGHLTKWLHRQAMQGLLPDKVLQRTTKADFMVLFRRQLDDITSELVNEILPRRSAWVRNDRARQIGEHYQDVAYSGWAEWWLWSLVGCDAVQEGR